VSDVSGMVSSRSRRGEVAQTFQTGILVATLTTFRTAGPRPPAPVNLALSCNEGTPIHSLQSSSSFGWLTVSLHTAVFEYVRLSGRRLGVEHGVHAFRLFWRRKSLACSSACWGGQDAYSHFLDFRWALPSGHDSQRSPDPKIGTNLAS